MWLYLVQKSLNSSLELHLDKNIPAFQEDVHMQFLQFSGTDKCFPVCFKSYVNENTLIC